MQRQREDFLRDNSQALAHNLFDGQNTTSNNSHQEVDDGQRSVGQDQAEGDGLGGILGDSCHCNSTVTTTDGCRHQATSDQEHEGTLGEHAGGGKEIGADLGQTESQEETDRDQQNHDHGALHSCDKLGALNSCQEGQSDDQHTDGLGVRQNTRNEFTEVFNHASAVLREHQTDKQNCQTRNTCKDRGQNQTLLRVNAATQREHGGHHIAEHIGAEHCDDCCQNRIACGTTGQNQCNTQQEEDAGADLSSDAY